MNTSELYHHGTKGQKWGIRKYQNPDGSLTPAGRERYGYGTKKYSAAYDLGRRKAAKDALKAKSKLEKQYKRASKNPESDKAKRAEKELNKFEANKNKSYKELGMSNKEIDYRDAEAAYTRRVGRAAIAGWALGGPFGAVIGAMGQQMTAKGRAYLSAYTDAYTDYQLEKNDDKKRKVNVRLV